MSDFDIFLYSNTQLTSRRYPKLKEVDDVLGGAAAWDNVDKTKGEFCPLSIVLLITFVRKRKQKERKKGIMNNVSCCCYLLFYLSQFENSWKKRQRWGNPMLKGSISAQFSPLTSKVIGSFGVGGWEHDRTTQQRSCSSLFCRRPSWAVLA